MAIPEEKIRKLLDYIKELDIKEFPWAMEDTSFAAASLIVKYSDPSLMTLLPEWAKRDIYGMRDTYLEQGSFGYISNLGSVDHSEMMHKLAQLLPQDK